MFPGWRRAGGGLPYPNLFAIIVEADYGHAVERDDTVPEDHTAFAEVLRIRGKGNEPVQEEARARERNAQAESERRFER